MTRAESIVALLADINAQLTEAKEIIHAQAQEIERLKALAETDPE